MPAEDGRRDTTTHMTDGPFRVSGIGGERGMVEPKGATPTEQITISTSRAVIAMLTSLAGTRLYGNDAPSVAEQLIRLKLIELVDQGKITTPPRPALPWEKPEEE